MTDFCVSIIAQMHENFVNTTDSNCTYPSSLAHEYSCIYTVLFFYINIFSCRLGGQWCMQKTLMLVCKWPCTLAWSQSIKLMVLPSPLLPSPPTPHWMETGTHSPSHSTPLDSRSQLSFFWYRRSGFCFEDTAVLLYSVFLSPTCGRIPWLYSSLAKALILHSNNNAKWQHQPYGRIV